jgi:hypothetical protein
VQSNNGPRSVKLGHEVRYGVKDLEGNIERARRQTSPLPSRESLPLESREAHRERMASAKTGFAERLHQAGREVPTARPEARGVVSLSTGM